MKTPEGANMVGGTQQQECLEGAKLFVWRVGALCIQELLSIRSRTLASREEDGEESPEPRERGLLCVCWNEFVQDHKTPVLDLLLIIATSSWGRRAKGTCFISNSDFGPIFLSGVIPEEVKGNDPIFLL